MPRLPPIGLNPTTQVGFPCKKTIGMAGLVPGQSPGDLGEFRLVVRQVPERDAGQQIVDPLLEHSPDRPDAAPRLRTTSAGTAGMEIAGDVERAELRGLH